MITNDVQETQHVCPEQPPREEYFVALPGHPLYGQKVQVLSRQRTSTYTRCVVETAALAGFRYQVPERWLSMTQPPTEPAPESRQQVIVLPLQALDRMVQMVLTKSEMEEARNDEADRRQRQTNLDTTARYPARPTQRTPLLPGMEPGGRDTP
jgi:hypothetical protein